MKNLLILYFIISGNILPVAAQKQGNIWYSGNYMGLDFNQGAPVVISNSQMLAAEGSSVISDSTGSLLFYSNGARVWNRNHQVMPNGDSLLGHWSSTQAALIIPLPGSSRFFYLFTTDAFYINQLQYGFRYSIVDMCLDNTGGDIIPGEKNILLLDTVAEKLTAVRASNGIDYWVIVHKFYSDAFYAYRLSSLGIVDTVISHVGSVHGTSIGQAIGQLKASPDGSKLATVTGNAGYLSIAEYFDFDHSTGVVSNWVDLKPSTGGQDQFYGVSFSQDNSKLYIACWLNGNGVYQYDLTRGGGIPDSVRASRINLAPPTSYYGMQLGPDGKIYVARGGGGGNFSTIHNPNLAGTAANFDDTGIYFNGSGGGMTPTGFIDSYDYSNQVTTCTSQAAFSADNHICLGACIGFSNSSFNATAYQWYFPGATPNSSTDAEPDSICYSNTGSYDVELIAYGLNGNDTLTLTNYIIVYPQPAAQGISQSGDTLFANQGAASYQWYFNANIINGSTDYFYVATSSGDYNVIATDTNGCEVEAVINDVIASLNQFPVSSSRFAIFPNPVEDKFTIHNAEFTMGTAVEISIYNVMGERVMIQESGGKIQEEIIDVSKLRSGLYYLEVTSGEKIYRTKFLKQ